MGLFFGSRLGESGLNVEAACCNHIGKKRNKNEDNYFFQGKILPLGNDGLSDVTLRRKAKTKKGLLFAIFDGMGGEADGEIASYLAAKTCADSGLFTLAKIGEQEAETGENLAGNNQAAHIFGQFIDEMNRVVYREARKRFNTMGTTAVMLYIKEQNMWMCNLGDSKAFFWGEDKLTQISKDHTDAEFLKTHGITDRKPVLNQCLGMDPEEVLLDPFVVERGLQKGDCFLLCSDGLTDMLSRERISQILGEEKTAWDCAERLKQESLENGGMDNITVIVVKIR